MIGAQRRFHAVLWPLLAVALCAVIASAIVARAHVNTVMTAAPHARPF